MQYPEQLIPKAEKYDMIVVTCQEIVRSLKTTYVEFLEVFLEEKGFVNIEDSYNEMWEMFMVIFVKSHL